VTENMVIVDIDRSISSEIIYRGMVADVKKKFFLRP
jgi:hypothetical protein